MRATAANATENRPEHGPLASDDDPTSSSGTSSESESESEEEDSEDEDNDMQDTQETTMTARAPSISNIPGRPKPNIHRIGGGSDLLSRLSTFLPKMKNANEDLEREIAAGRGKDMVLDSVDDDDDKDYIEMNLGLGVLEEKRGDGQDSSSGDEADDEGHEGDLQQSGDNGESDLLGQLMGGIRSKNKPSIEEMAD